MQHDSLKGISQLPLRVIPQPWEDLTSLVCRAARKMGYETPTWLLAPQGSAHRITAMHLPLLCWREEYSILGQQLGPDEQSLYQLTAHRFAPLLFPEQDKTPEIPRRFTRIPFPLLSTQAFRRFFLDEPLTKICPVCLDTNVELPYDRLYRRMKDVFVCPFHRVPLRERCPHCERKIPSLRLDPLFCSACQRGDYRYPTPKAIAPESALYAGTRIFLSTLGIIVQESESIPLIQTPLNHLGPRDSFTLVHRLRADIARIYSLEEILVLAVALGALSIEDARSQKAFFTTTDAAAFALSYALFLEWPGQFFAFHDLLYLLHRISTTERKSAYSSTLIASSHPLFFSFSEDAKAPWLRDAYHKHAQRFSSTKQEIEKMHARIEELIIQVGLGQTTPLRWQDRPRQHKSICPLSLPEKIVPFP